MGAEKGPRTRPLSQIGVKLCAEQQKQRANDHIRCPGRSPGGTCRKGGVIRCPLQSGKALTRKQTWGWVLGRVISACHLRHGSQQVRRPPDKEPAPMEKKDGFTQAKSDLRGRGKGARR